MDRCRGAGRAEVEMFCQGDEVFSYALLPFPACYQIARPARLVVVVGVVGIILGSKGRNAGADHAVPEHPLESIAGADLGEHPVHGSRRDRDLAEGGEGGDGQGV